MLQLSKVFADLPLNNVICMFMLVFDVTEAFVLTFSVFPKSERSINISFSQIITYLSHRGKKTIQDDCL